MGDEFFFMTLWEEDEDDEKVGDVYDEDGYGCMDAWFGMGEVGWTDYV